VRRDAQRIDIMKKALKAKRRYLVATARAETSSESSKAIEELAAEAEDDGWDEDKPSVVELAATRTFAAVTPSTTSAVSTTTATNKRASTAAPITSVSAPAPAPAPVAVADSATHEDEWGDNESEAPARSDDEEGVSGVAGGGKTDILAGARTDSYGELPEGWTVQVDDEGDVWYYNEKTQQTSCESLFGFFFVGCQHNLFLLFCVPAGYRPNPDGSVPDA
jgi:hypothetical protein